jgi:hypothetical protein
VLDLNDQRFTDGMIRRFIGHVSTLSVQKFSSNVIEKCIRMAQQDTRKYLISELLNRDRLERLLRDPYANYVVQTALDYADPLQRSQLVDCIRPLLPAVRNTPYGKRIQSKLQRDPMASGTITPPNNADSGSSSSCSSIINDSTHVNGQSTSSSINNNSNSIKSINDTVNHNNNNNSPFNNNNGNSNNNSLTNLAVGSGIIGSRPSGINTTSNNTTTTTHNNNSTDNINGSSNTSSSHIVSSHPSLSNVGSGLNMPIASALGFGLVPGPLTPGAHTGNAFASTNTNSNSNPNIWWPTSS